MLLKSLHLSGFKTFPDKISLSFDKGITAVVGPNGSGKSNVSDAIRWVLGEQSTRNLRCAKMEDVIFNGTQVRKAKGFAEVTLAIENFERKLPFDQDEVFVTRRYYRSGDSEYLINNATVRLKDIHELFMDTGLGRDGYSMIGQGKIDSIVASRSDERREIFEEAAGISRYRYRKADAQKKLEQAQENLVRLNDILQELETRVGPLKEQSEKAKEYLELSKEKCELEIGIWLATLQKSGEILRSHQEKLMIVKSNHDSLDDELEALRIKMEQNFSEGNSCVARVDELRREILLCEEMFADKNKEVSLLENNILHNNENINRIKLEIEDSHLFNKAMDDEIEKKKIEIEIFKDIFKEKQEALDEKTKELDQLQNQVSQFSDFIGSMTKELSHLSVQASDKKVKVITSKNSIQDIEARIVKFNFDIKVLQNKIVESQRAIEDYNLMMKDVLTQIESLNNNVNGYEIKLKNRKEKFEEAKKRFDKLNLDLEDKIRRIRLLEELERNMEGFAHSVKLVMKESDRGSLSGIHGPLSRLIKVENRYTPAIETALGGALQNIIVDNENDAKRAIYFLKNKNAGRATFLPLSNIKGYRIDEADLKSNEGFVGIASDLCSCEDKYQEILKSLLGRIVVAENLDSATVIAKMCKYKYRVVTLDGQVINAGGSLTGGSLAKNVGILSRANEIKKLQLDYDEIKVQAKKTQESLKNIQIEISSIEAELLGIKGDLISAKDEETKISHEQRRLTLESESSKLSLESLEKEKDESIFKINELKVSCQEAQKESLMLSTRIQEIEAKLNKNMGDKEQLSLDRETIIHQIQELKIEIFSANKDAESLEYEIKSIEQRKQTANEKTQNLELQIKDFTAKNSDIINNIEEIKVESAEIKDQSKAFQEAIESLNQQRLMLEKKSTDLRNFEREKTNERENIGRELAKLEEQKVNFQKEYDVIIEKLWEEYELTRREAEEKYKAIEDVPRSSRRLNEIKNKIKLLGSVNIAAIEEYKEVAQRYNFMKEQVNDVEKSINELFKLINMLTKQMQELFMEKFNMINSNFKQVFRELFGGGNAELSLTNPDDILGSGVEIEVQPPGKIVNRLEALSGGERALIAIAIYFAIMKVNPPPFCVLDEIEAALDDVNVGRFAAYLRRMNENTQFITISHRRGTMEEADVLYGVTMQDEGVSKILKLDVSEIENKLGIK